MSDSLWQVAVNAPLNDSLTYKCPESFAPSLSRGQLVEVPLGNRKTLGVVLGQTTAIPEFELKNILRRVDDFPQLPLSFIQWLEWLADYYMYPIGRVAALAYPPIAKAKKPRQSKRPPVIPHFDFTARPQLTPEQKTCFENISKNNSFAAHLLFGVTGSGKTEVYLQLFEKIISEGKQGIFLVPEISLTPQLTQRFAERFGDRIAVIHSQLTERERTDQWWHMVEDKKSILIGARSALFCPVKNLGLIIVDEEHEQSFKQEEKLKYHARDAAVMLAKLHNCPIVLGSATPSLETWKNVQDKKYQMHELRSRVNHRPLPEITVIDLRKSKSEKSSHGQFYNLNEIPFWLSRELHQSICQTLDEKKQVALFLNRRGLAQSVVCESCGHTRECPNCDINLTLHAHSHLVCHYCDYHENFKNYCPDCKEGSMKGLGLGTELVENDLKKLFPNNVIARADRDEISSRVEMEEFIQRVESREIDILIGTQMIAKGLDFPHLKLVGLVLADIGFNLPDFRSTEKSFQLITQMSGRSGRHVLDGESPGKVMIQAYNTQHDSITYAQNHDFLSFAESELFSRQALGYPPHGKLLSFRVQGPRREGTQEMALLLANRSRALKTQNIRYEKIEILGPAEAPLSRIKNQFRHHVLLKGPSANILNIFTKQVLGTQEWLSSGIKIIVDVDPMSLL